MKLYYSKGACSLAVRIVIHEIGIDCDFELINQSTKKTASGKDFLSINPRGYVPTLVLDDQTVLTENSVIQQYLADTYQATSLLPKLHDMGRYRVLEWLNYISTELHKTAGLLFIPAIPEDLKNQFVIPKLKNRINFVDQQLSQNRYIVSDHFSLADAYLFVILSWLPKFKLELQQWPHIDLYFSKLKERASIKQSLQEEEAGER